MKTMKKFAVLALAACFAVGTAFSEKTLDEDIRFELNVSDSIGTRIINVNNTTDIAFDISGLEDSLGGRLGFMVRETFITDGDGIGFGLLLCPYVGFNFNGGCISFGGLYYPELNGWSPYFGFTWDFDLIPVKNGLSHSLALRTGMDWYVNYHNSDDAASAVFGTIFGSLIPNMYVGLTYKIGYGMKFDKNRDIEDTSSRGGFEYVPVVEKDDSWNDEDEYDSDSTDYSSGYYEDVDSASSSESDYENDDMLNRLFN